MENNSKVPTPGPWRYDDLGGYVWATEDRMVGQVRGFGASLPQNANGRLLAAAPEMLDRLKEAALQIRYLHEKFQSTGSGESVLYKIDYTIAKAEGK